PLKSFAFLYQKRVSNSPQVGNISHQNIFVGQKSLSTEFKIFKFSLRLKYSWVVNFKNYKYLKKSTNEIFTTSNKLL
ncbi:MAG: hypothetical protein ACTSR3_22940, partial [Candidatus Helarchaeota archaeon]